MQHCCDKKMLRFWVLVALSVNFSKGSPAIRNEDKTSNEVEGSPANLPTDSFLKCSYAEGFTGLLNCAATRALKMLQQAERTESFELIPGVALTSENPQSLREGKAFTDQLLPTDPKQKMEKLLDLIFDAASRFLSGRTLKIKIPDMTATGIATALEEGRGKRKKGMMSPLIIALGIKTLLLKALSLVGIGLMALKAALIAKVAFVIAVILASQSLFGGSGFNLKNLGGGSPNFGGHGWVSGWAGGSGHGPSTSYGSPGWTTNNIGGWGNSQYPYARSIDDIKESEEPKVDAQDLAYSQQKP